MECLDDQENGGPRAMNVLREEGRALKETTNQDDHRVLVQVKKIQVDSLEMRRINKELQLQKRDLRVQLEAAQAQIANLQSQRKVAEADAAALKRVKEELSRQVEALQNQRFSEVEEVVYLRWVNACLRYELRSNGTSGSLASTATINGNNNCQAMELNKVLSPRSKHKAKQLLLEYAGPEIIPDRTSDHVDCETSTTKSFESGNCRGLNGFSELQCDGGKKASSLMKKLSWTCSSKSKRRANFVAKTFGSSPDMNEHGAINSIAQSFQVMSRSADLNAELADRYPTFKDRHKLANSTDNKAFCPGRTAPQPSTGSSPSSPLVTNNSLVPPPPPPPPLPKLSLSSPLAMSSDCKPKVHRVPQLIELYHTMMKRSIKKDGMGVAATRCNAHDVRTNIIGEIENRSSHLLAIKTDVETQGGFVKSLALEVRSADYTNMDDLVAFVTWLDQKLAFLVDERAVLKHFNWPEAKADALREAAFEYRDLKNLEHELASFEDDQNMKSDAALNKMSTLLERTEHSIYAFLRTREKSLTRYKEFEIPTCWMLDGSLVEKTKQSSVKLAEKFMKRVVSEMDGRTINELMQEFLLLQGVRFAFRVHQFAGGFDKKSMQAFEELQTRARDVAHNPCMP